MTATVLASAANPSRILPIVRVPQIYSCWLAKQMSCPHPTLFLPNTQSPGRLIQDSSPLWSCVVHIVGGVPLRASATKHSLFLSTDLQCAPSFPLPLRLWGAPAGPHTSEWMFFEGNSQSKGLRAGMKSPMRHIVPPDSSYGASFPPTTMSSVPQSCSSLVPLRTVTETSVSTVVGRRKAHSPHTLPNQYSSSHLCYPAPHNVSSI